jgi:hypothetical protein
LRFNLDRHPEVFAPPVELNWFSDATGMRGLGRRWYQLQFDAWLGEPVLGESSPSYLKRRHRPDLTAEWIHKVVPDARLVALLRNPVDRFESAVRMYVKRGRLPADVDPMALVLRNDPLVAELDLIGGGLYAQSLYPYRLRFRDQLLVIDHDRVGREPEAVYDSVLHHIGATPGFVPDDLAEVRFSDRPTVAGPVLTDEQRRLLYTAFRRDVEELEAMLGWDLRAWDPGPPSPDQASEIAAVLDAVPSFGPPPEAGHRGSVDEGDESDEPDDPEYPAQAESAVAT